MKDEESTPLKRLSSQDGRKSINIVCNKVGFYHLEHYSKKYDEEEEVHYQVRVEPNPIGRFDTIEDAVAEAQRLLRTR